MPKKFFVIAVKETTTFEEGFFLEAKQLAEDACQVTDMLSNAPYGEIFSKEDFEDHFAEVTEKEYNDYYNACEEGYTDTIEEVVMAVNSRVRKGKN